MKKVNLFMALALVIGLLLTIGPVAQASTPDWYVDDNCTAPGAGTASDPFCLIQDAIDGASDGDTIKVMNGIYTEALSISGKGLTIIGESETGVIVQAAASQTGAANVFTINASGYDITIQKMTIRHGDYGIRSTAGNVNVLHCTFYHNGWDGTGVPATPTASAMATFWSTYATNGGAMRIENSSSSEIAYCTIYENDRGIRYQDGDNGDIHHNTIYDNIQSGIYLAASTYTGASGCSNTQVYDNESYANMEHGLLSIGGINNTFKNNNLHDNWNAGVMLWHAGENTIQNNTIAGNVLYAFNGWGASSDADAGVHASGSNNDPSATFVFTLLNNTFQDHAIQVQDDLNVLDIANAVAQNTFDRAVTVDHGGSLLPTIWGNIQDAIDAASSGDTVNVAKGTYSEGVTLTPGTDMTIVGAGRDVTTWICPSGGRCISGNMDGYTGSMNYEISGFTFNCRSDPTATYGMGIGMYKARNGPLTLSIHDNRFVEDIASADDTHWATSMLLCHNRVAARDSLGNAPVHVYNNIDETLGGMTMSNSQGYDIYDNLFDGCSDAIYNGHGCPDTAGNTFGDHHIYGNTFKNASDAVHPGALTPAIDWQYYGAGEGTHLPSIIEDNLFKNNDTAIRFVMDTDMTYPAHVVRNNDFINNGMAIRVTGDYASILNAEYNWWGDGSGPTHVSNPGGNGDPVSDNVDFDPWLGEPTAITLVSFTAQAGVGSAALAWETGTEVDNAGFNLYRAAAPDGPYTRINAALIVAEGDPVAGASYSFVDTGLAGGVYYYELEDVDLNGVTTLHGPVAAIVLPRFRRPALRPAAPGI